MLEIPSTKTIHRKLTQTIEGAHTDCVNCVRFVLILEEVFYNLQYTGCFFQLALP